MSGQPPTHLLDLVPDAEALLLLQPEEIGELLMELIHAGPAWGGGLTAAHAATAANRHPPPHREALREAIVEAWSWLEHAGLISRYKPGEGDPNQCFVTRRARSMRTCAEVALYRKAGLLPKELLHPKLVEKVWTLFIRGDYEAAVFQAFKEVEVAVRAAGAFTTAERGVALMRKAFDVEGGPLTDPSGEDGERQALSDLFAGAIGSYQNPHSQRTVTIADPAEAVEMILLASHLLRLVATRKPATP